MNPGTKEIYLTVTGVSSAANLTWLGDLSADWDVGTANWRNGGVASVFATGGNVTFDNTSSTTNVNLAIDAAPGSVLVNSTKNYLFDTAIGTGKITGTASLVKTNTGTLTLVTDNDYVGPTTILKGNVVIGDDVNARGKFDAGAITNNGTVTYNRPDDLSIADTFSGTGNLVKIGGNTLTMLGVNNCAGGITISNGSVAINTYAALSSNGVVLAGGQLTIYPAGGAASGLAGQVNVVDNSTISYASSGTYACVFTGPLTGTPGKMLTLSPTSGSTSRVRLYGTFTNDADLNLNGSAMFLAPYISSGFQVFNGVVSGSGAIIARCHGGRAVLNNAGNTYSGGTMLSLGAVGVGADSVMSGDTIVSGPLGTGPIVSTTESSTTGSCTLLAVGGARTIANPITYDVGANLTTIVLGGTNNLTLSGAMSLNGNDGNITNREINVINTALSTLSGVIGDGGLAGTLTKTGNGILVLSGANTYTGPTLVGAGTLWVNGQLGIGGVAVTNGALGGSGSIAGPVMVDVPGTLAPGTASLGTLTINNSLTLGGNAVFKVNKSLSPAQSNDVASVTGVLSNAGTGTLTVSNLGPALVVGDKFFLFNKALAGGGTLTVSGGGMNWTNRLALDGSIQALSVASSLASYPTNITAGVAGGALTISWPTTHLGWILQSQTNALTTGLTAPTNTWVDVSGSDAVTQEIIPINPANPAVFLRLRHP